MNALRSAFFEDLAQIRDAAATSARGAMADEGATWAEHPGAFERLRSLIRSPEDLEAFSSAVQEFVHVALHSALMTIDGGTSSSRASWQS